MPHKKWHDHNVSKYITMKYPENSPSYRTLIYFKNIIQYEINRFNKLNIRESVSFDKYIDDFIIKFVGDDLYNINIVISLYIFIFDYYRLSTGLKISSNYGRSTQTFLSHLFKGALVFESLAKQLYPYKGKNKKKKATLSGVLGNKKFKDKYGEIDSNATTLSEIIDFISVNNDDKVTSAITTLFKLRNTASHNLQLDDIFYDISNYNNIYFSIMNALHIIIYDNFLSIEIT